MSAVDATSVASVVPAGRWLVDPSGSSVSFTLKHMMLATVNGRFHEFDGTLETGPGAPRAIGVVKAASLDTNEAVRDEHLRGSPDFFDVARYPKISFSSTRIERAADGRLRIVGELTMRSITREIELDAKVGATTRGPGGVERVELALRGELNRRDFGLTWNQALEAGGALLGNKVKIALDISAVKALDFPTR